jgi:hypothetical protein
MFNLDKLLYNMLETVRTYRGDEKLMISDRDVSLSARLNYYIRFFRRFQNYLSSYKEKSSLNTVNSAAGSVNISGQTTGTAYYWKDLQLNSSGTYTENGLYVIYNGKILGHADMSTSNGIHYTHFDITLPAPINSYIGGSNVDAAVFCSVYNNRVLGVHGCLRGTSTLKIYLYSTTSTDYIDSRINVLIYIPKTEVTRIIK